MTAGNAFPTFPTLPTFRLAAAFTLLLAACAGRRPVEKVTVPPGASLRQVEDSLAAHGLVWRPWFRLVAKLGRFERSLKPGVYQFAPGTSSLAILRDLRDGRFLSVKVTVPEGHTIYDIAAAGSTALGFPRDSLLAAARDPGLLRKYGIHANTAEGYLAADTYFVPALSSARELVGMMLEQFRAHWDPAWDAELERRDLTRHEALTLASIVEAEARVDEERPIIAAVYLNRIRIGMPLQADPTVQYAMMQQTGERKPRLYYNDYRFESPYNTYLMRGLPPGPVGAPSRASILAVLRPAEVPYLYFVARPDGRHTFSRNYTDHLRAIAESRRGSKAAEGGRSQ
jgi:UPF0755 protein